MEQAGRATLEQIKQLEARRDNEGLLALLDPALPALYRQAAARALAKVATADTAPRLAAVLPADPDRVVRLALVQALGRLGNDHALTALLASLKDSELGVRQAAATALSRYNSPAAFETLLKALQQNEEESDWQVRRFAAESLGQLADRRAVPALVESLRDPHPLVRPAVATALGRLGDRDAISPLKRARHVTPHQRGADCAECQAIDAALKELES